MYSEAWRRGWEWATIKVVLGDGAIWSASFQNQLVPCPINTLVLDHSQPLLQDSARLPHVLGGLAQRWGVGHDQSGSWRRGHLDLESGRSAFSWRYSNRGSVSCPPAFMENSRPASPPRSGGEKTLDDSHERPAG